jgi:hypothetical protein
MNLASSAPRPALAALSELWSLAGLALGDARDAGDVELPGQEPVLPSSFAVATALQASLAAAARAAVCIGRWRGGPDQTVSVAAQDVVLESSGRFSLDGRTPEMWDKLSGLYACGSAVGRPGWVRIHANFAHHRDIALRLLELPAGSATQRQQVEQSLRHWRAEDFEDAVARAGGVVAALRSFDEWDAHPQGAAVRALPLLGIERLGDAPAPPPTAWQPGQRPLQGLRVLDLTRILAGPVGTRTLAAYGADVMLVNSPNLPNIESIAETSRGKLSVHLDLATVAGRDHLRALVEQADVLVQGYRPGALAALGFGVHDLLRMRPDLVCVSLSAYGETGPWGERRGFDSLVQTATGFNQAEAQAFGASQPRALPLQALDYSAGFLLAFGALAALLRRAREGGGWQVQVSLARTGQWLRSLGRCTGFEAVPMPSVEPALETSQSGYGRLDAVRHAAHLSVTPAIWDRPSMPPGSHPPAWPPR